MTALAGGAWLLADMVRAATGERVLSQAQPRLADTPPTDVLHSIAELAEYPKDGSPDGQKEKVLRVERVRGFCGPDSGVELVPSGAGGSSRQTEAGDIRRRRQRVSR
jgi:hypothetical protein